jgi:hypothetical protein
MPWLDWILQNPSQVATAIVTLWTLVQEVRHQINKKAAKAE